VLFDIKHWNPEEHLSVIGVSNQIILQNLERITALGKAIIVRIPIIPGFNDSKETMEDVAKFLKGLNNISGVELLPYHRYGINKYEKLDRQYNWVGEPPSESQMAAFRRIFEEHGLKTTVH